MPGSNEDVAKMKLFSIRECMSLGVCELCLAVGGHSKEKKTEEREDNQRMLDIKSEHK